MDKNGPCSSVCKEDIQFGSEERGKEFSGTSWITRNWIWIYIVNRGLVLNRSDVTSLARNMHGPCPFSWAVSERVC